MELVEAAVAEAVAVAQRSGWEVVPWEQLVATVVLGTTPDPTPQGS